VVAAGWQVSAEPGWLSGERRQSWLWCTYVEKTPLRIGWPAELLQLLAGGVDSLQSCPLDVSRVAFRIITVVVTD
jgi:hypothetical protein